ncbi:MAG: penicillin-binding protein 2 [Candidatus Binatia bacterium]
MISLGSQKEVPPEFRYRTQILLAIVAVIFLFLFGRLFFLQVIDGERYTYLSENNRIRLKKVPGTRGMVLDRRGQLLVDSRPSFDLLFVPEDAPEAENTLRQLARFLGRDEAELLKLLQENKSRTPFQEIVLGKDIDWASMVAVEAHQLDLPGVTLRTRPRRSYVESGMAAHLLGYLGEIGPRQLKTQKVNGYSMGDEIGQFGLERRWEEFLRGQSGGQQVEVDALGRRVRVLDEVEDIPGYNVVLTIDKDVQQAAYEGLKGKDGAIVALDVNSGAVLAMASTPAFDPNVFARGVTSQELRSLNTDRAHPFNNRAIQGQYPPGSTFKIVLTVASLEEEALPATQLLSCGGSWTVGNRSFRDWKKEGHGPVDLHKGLVHSCDVYYYQLGQRLGIDQIAKHARNLGLGEKTGIALDDEKPGLIPDTEWKKRRFNQPWYPGETPSAAIGQGYITVTPLQMANLMAIIGNGGTRYRPWFVSKVVSLDGSVIQEYGPEKLGAAPLKETTVAFLKNTLRDVVSAGTGGRAKSEIVSIGGKTGTAQVAEMKGAYLKSEQLAYAIRDHAWFVAYAPTENPEIAVAVLVEHGGHGGSAAAPLAKSVIEKYFSVRGEPPDRTLAGAEGDARAN